MSEHDATSLVLENRAFLYSYLARAFAKEPDVAFLEVVTSDIAREHVALLDEDGIACELQKKIAAAALEFGESLSGDYVKLFIGPGEVPVPPWESVFVTRKQLLFQECTLAVREAYQRAGFRSSRYPHEAEDHLSLELEFLGRLARQAADAHEVLDEERCREALRVSREFLEDHLLVWLHEYAAQMEKVDVPNGVAKALQSPVKNSVTTFYPSFALLADIVCHRDLLVIKEL